MVIYNCIFVFINLLNACQGWRVVMKVATDEPITPATSLYDLWQSSLTLEDTAAGYANVESSYSSPNFPSYKSQIVNNWKKNSVQQVKVAMYDDKAKEVMSIAFTSSWSDDKMSWFHAKNTIQTGQRYKDLDPLNIQKCSILGDETYKRRFMIFSNYINMECNEVKGWMVIVDQDRSGQCHWDYNSILPRFLYSPNDTAIAAEKMSVAAVFVVFVDDCVANPCKHRGACTNNNGDAVCNCSSQYYGDRCQIVCPCEEGTCVEVAPGNTSINPEIFQLGGKTLACNCRDGFQGQYCSIDIDECRSNPCKNGGICKDSKNKFECICATGYWDDTCSSFDAQDDSSVGAKVAIGICVPLGVVVIVLIVAYAIYIKRNPDGYGRATKRIVMARDLVRRSFRRMSGRMKRKKERESDETTKDNKRIVSKDVVSAEHVNPAFVDYDNDNEIQNNAVPKYNRQDSEHVDLSPNDQAIFTGGQNKSYTPQQSNNLPSLPTYSSALPYGRNASPRPDSERSFPDSRESNTSGSLYQEVGPYPGLTPNYGPSYESLKPSPRNIAPEQSYQELSNTKANDNAGLPRPKPRYAKEREAHSPSYEQTPKPKTPLGRPSDLHINSGPRNDDRYSHSRSPGVQLDDRYNQSPNVQVPRTPKNDMYNQQPYAHQQKYSPEDRYNATPYAGRDRVHSEDRYNQSPVSPTQREGYSPDHHSPSYKPPRSDMYSSSSQPARRGDRSPAYYAEQTKQPSPNSQVLYLDNPEAASGTEI